MQCKKPSKPDVLQPMSKGTKLGHFAKPNIIKMGVWRIFDIWAGPKRNPAHGLINPESFAGQESL